MISENVTMALTGNACSAYNVVNGFEMLIVAAVIFIGVIVYAVAYIILSAIIMAVYALAYYIGYMERLPTSADKGKK